jgi:hypothetical protein
MKMKNHYQQTSYKEDEITDMRSKLLMQDIDKTKKNATQDKRDQQNDSWEKIFSFSIRNQQGGEKMQ